MSLTMSCVESGIELFASCLDGLFGDERKPVTQNEATRHYRYADLPNGGYVDLRWPYAQVDRLLRSTDFRPYPNTFTYAKLKSPRGDLIVNDASIAGNRPPIVRPGEVVTADDRLVVACADSLIQVGSVMLEPDEETSIETAVTTLSLKPGDVLTAPTGDGFRPASHDRSSR